MQTVTNEQIYSRWAQVPIPLREAFFSTDNGELIWKACEDQGLAEDVIDQVLIVFGNVLLGFTHINDIAKEMQSIPGMDQKAIDPIIFQMDQRIFGSIKADILRLYGAMSGTGPRIVAEEASPVGEITAPAVIGDEASAQVDIRKVRIGESVTEPDRVPTEEKLETASTGVAPAIIHTEAELKPVAQKRRPLSSFGGMFGFRKGQEKSPEGPAVAAQVSMIEGLGKRPQEMARTEQQPVKVVHYTSAKAPEDIFGQSTQAQKEATAFVPVTKQEHVIDFEPKVVNMMPEEKPMDPIPAMPAEGVPVAPVGSVGQAIPAAPATQTPAEVPAVVVMKTPQRVETVAATTQQEKEPRLAEIPVASDIVDLRMLERVEKKEK